jgi:hypothetical protein
MPPGGSGGTGSGGLGGTPAATPAPQPQPIPNPIPAIPPAPRGTAPTKAKRKEEINKLGAKIENTALELDELARRLIELDNGIRLNEKLLKKSRERGNVSLSTSYLIEIDKYQKEKDKIMQDAYNNISEKEYLERKLQELNRKISTTPAPAPAPASAAPAPAPASAAPAAAPPFTPPAAPNLGSGTSGPAAPNLGSGTSGPATPAPPKNLSNQIPPIPPNPMVTPKPPAIPPGPFSNTTTPITPSSAPVSNPPPITPFIPPAPYPPIPRGPFSNTTTPITPSSAPVSNPPPITPFIPPAPYPPIPRGPFSNTTTPITPASAPVSNPPPITPFIPPAPYPPIPRGPFSNTTTPITPASAPVSNPPPIPPALPSIQPVSAPDAPISPNEYFNQEIPEMKEENPPGDYLNYLDYLKKRKNYEQLAFSPPSTIRKKTKENPNEIPPFEPVQLTPQPSISNLNLQRSNLLMSIINDSINQEDFQPQIPKLGVNENEYQPNENQINENEYPPNEDQINENISPNSSNKEELDNLTRKKDRLQENIDFIKSQLKRGLMKEEMKEQQKNDLKRLRKERDKINDQIDEIGKNSLPENEENNLETNIRDDWEEIEPFSSEKRGEKRKERPILLKEDWKKRNTNDYDFDENEYEDDEEENTNSTEKRGEKRKESSVLLRGPYWKKQNTDDYDFGGNEYEEDEENEENTNNIFEPPKNPFIVEESRKKAKEIISKRTAEKVEKLRNEQIEESGLKKGVIEDETEDTTRKLRNPSNSKYSNRNYIERLKNQIEKETKILDNYEKEINDIIKELEKNQRENRSPDNSLIEKLEKMIKTRDNQKSKKEKLKTQLFKKTSSK